MFKLTFSTDNVAFADEPLSEIAAALHTVARRLDGCRCPPGVGDAGFIKDTNGNRIGSWFYEPSDGAAGRDGDE